MDSHVVLDAELGQARLTGMVSRCQGVEKYMSWDDLDLDGAKDTSC